MTLETKIKCCNQICLWTGLNSHALVIASPFDPTQIQTACPRCKDIQTLIIACEEKDCWEDGSSQTRTGDRYKRHCEDHPPMERQK